MAGTAAAGSAERLNLFAEMVGDIGTQLAADELAVLDGNLLLFFRPDQARITDTLVSVHALLSMLRSWSKPAIRNGTAGE
jgi:hypothetical protein